MECSRSIDLCAFSLLLCKENLRLEALSKKNARYADYRKERHARIRDTSDYREKRKAAYEAKKQDPEWVQKGKLLNLQP